LPTSSRFLDASRRAACTLGDGIGLEQQPQSKHLVDLAARKAAHLEAAMRVDVDQPLGAQPYQRFPYRDLADAEFGRDGILQQRRAGRVDAGQDLVADPQRDLRAHGANQRLGHRMPQQ
jgi:hypothetical protein